MPIPETRASKRTGKPLNIIQIDVRKKHDTCDHNCTVAKNHDIDIGLISEFPNRKKSIIESFEEKKLKTLYHKGGDNPRAAIVFFKDIKNLEVFPLTDISDEYHYSVKLVLGQNTPVVLTSVYHRPLKDSNNGQFVEKLEWIIWSCRQFKHVIGGDVNAHSPRWGCPDTSYEGLAGYDITNRRNF